jgi:hypothetical protein
MGKAHTCVTCPMLETKPGRGIATDGDLEVMTWLERFDTEIIAGRPLIIEEMTALEWECWVMWSNLKLAYERTHQQRISGMFETMMALLMRG